MVDLPKIVVFTPAGRQRYMQLLEHHVLNDPAVSAWYVLDNCRNENDRAWLHQHLATHPKVKLFTKPAMQGTAKAIHAFYHDLNEPDTFYIKVDDDIIWTQPNFFGTFAARAAALGDAYTWFSPLVVNNAICNWLVKHFTTITYPQQLFCMSACPTSWLDPDFAAFVHDVFLKLYAKNGLHLYHMTDKPIMLSRFSINCIGFWGRDRLACGDHFAPLNTCDDEEWISAVWPLKTGKPGLIMGDQLVSHFSFYPQEQGLLQTDILEHYYQLQGKVLDPRLLEAAREVEKRQLSF